MKYWFTMYIDGFKNMPRWARILWVIILIKIVVFFAVLRPLFFPRILQSHFQDDAARSNHVIECITQPSQSSDSP
jgi:flagellar basal body-associated protein FliL